MLDRRVYSLSDLDWLSVVCGASRTFWALSGHRLPEDVRFP